MKVFFGLPAAILDMWIYIILGIITPWIVLFGSDEAAKYIGGFVLFLIKVSLVGSNGGLLAAKMYRSKGFADHEKEKQDTTRFTRPAP